MNTALVNLFKNLLRDTVSLNLNYYSYPFSDISSFDYGFRLGLKNSDQLYDRIREMMEALEDQIYLLYTDGCFLKYVFCKPSSFSRDVLVVGPFLSFTVDSKMIGDVMRQNHLIYDNMDSIQRFLEQIPVFPNNLSILSVLKDILDYTNPEASSFQVVNRSYQDMPDAQDYTPTDNYLVLAQATEQRYKLQEELREAVKLGDYTKAISISRKFMSLAYGPRISDALEDKKQNLFITNTSLHIAVANANVHPVFIHSLSSKHVYMIHKAFTPEELDHLYEKIVHNYCLLVQNKSRSQYSKLIRDALNYIDFNMNQAVSLSDIAEYLHVTPPHLSKVFKKEMGTTISDYILETKIHESLHLLSATDLRIQEVADRVGIFDYNYYAKLFKRYVGCSPTAYRKNIQNNC